MTEPHDDVAEWIKILHAAQKSGNQDDMATAAEHIVQLNRAGNVADTMQASAEEDARSPLSQAADVPLAAGLGALQGATLGFAGRNQTIKNALAGAREKEPLATATGDVAGSLLLPGSLLPSKSLSMARPLTRLATTGAVTGGVMGGIRGANEAEPGQRGMGALVGGGTGALLGLTPAALKVAGAAPRRLAQAVDKAWGTDAGEAATAGTPMRQRLVEWAKRGTKGPTMMAPAKPRPPLSPAAQARFNRAFGKKAEMAPVLEQLGTSNRTPMNISTDDVKTALANAAATGSQPDAMPAGKGKVFPYYPRGGTAVSPSQGDQPWSLLLKTLQEAKSPEQANQMIREAPPEVAQQVLAHLQLAQSLQQSLP